MIASTAFTVFTLALAAVAYPSPCGSTGGDKQEPTVGGTTGTAQCGNGQVISCCNTATSSNGEGLVAIGGVLNGALNCSPLDVAALAVTVPISHACSGNQAACCTGNQSGLVNAQCTNINV